MLEMPLVSFTCTTVQLQLCHSINLSTSFKNRFNGNYRSAYTRRRFILKTFGKSDSSGLKIPDSLAPADLKPAQREYESTGCQVLLNAFIKSLSQTRRALCANIIVSSLFPLSGYALGDNTVSLEDVTRIASSSRPLYQSEERIAELFERNTYSVVNIFDATLSPQLNMNRVEVPEGNGSGVVWDGEGHVVTNYHVIGNALSRNPVRGQLVARVNILTAEGVQESFDATLVGADRSKDLAILKVDVPVSLLRPIKVGTSSRLRVGQRCFAIGNPFGFDHTLTAGILSGLNREIFSQTGITINGGIQTDAAINPGNSGGPLLDSRGNLIGVNTAIFTQTGTSAGVGFAIPSDTVVKYVPQLINLGKVVRPGLNVDIASEAIANQLNVRNGALILSVPQNSAAAKSGLSSTRRGFAGSIVLGDVIIGLDDHPIKNGVELSKILEDYNVGDRVTLKVQRGNDVMEIPLTLEESMA
eukprot:TRINITY_DN5177_c0_g1_i1.p1 TRINITY_DN5177_c0_g1~~TRINITY_DN5177_c0_g1_i1.p1  ORF type:complete len:472 (+),score=86.14 TRINITY_DN5177_c0_g1_i1:170-1585(+)